MSVVVQQSSCLQQEFIGTVQDGSNEICLDSDGSDFIIMDMRMQAGETIIQISLDTESYLFVLPHDSNFRELYDEQKTKGWFENMWSALECVDENYQPTGSTMMSTTGLFQGVHTSADGTQGGSYLLMEITASGVGFVLSEDGQNAVMADSDLAVSVIVGQSSGFQQEFTGTLGNGECRIYPGYECKELIAEDMRMRAGETAVQICLGGEETYLFMLPHDSNFREVYDIQQENGWMTAQAQSGGDSSDTPSDVSQDIPSDVSQDIPSDVAASSSADAAEAEVPASEVIRPEVKAVIDEYLNYFVEAAQNTEKNNVGIVSGFTIMNTLDEFAKLDRSQFTQAEEEYYNNAYNKAVEYLQVGMIGGMITGILSDF